MEFSGRGAPLSQEGIASVTDQLGVGAAALWAVLRVETKGCGFLSDRRPLILFERHIFHRETHGGFDATAPELSAVKAGGYGAGGAHQYERLTRAIALDRAAAMRSASWGIGQVMGFHAAGLGFPDVETMVSSMVDSEDAQLEAMAGFIRTAGLHRAMQQHDWTAFARGYNGAGFARNKYDTKLASEHATLVAKGLPDVKLRAAQIYLLYRGFDPGPVDGLTGAKTAAAIKRFQKSLGLAATGELDDGTLARLAAPSP
jgi:hypothetical protein